MIAMIEVDHDDSECIHHRHHVPISYYRNLSVNIYLIPFYNLFEKYLLTTLHLYLLTTYAR